MSALGRGLLEGFSGALAAKEQDYQQAKELQERFDLLEYQQQQKKELLQMQRAWEQIDVAQGIEEQKRREGVQREELEITEAGKDRRAALVGEGRGTASERNATGEQKKRALDRFLIQNAEELGFTVDMRDGEPDIGYLREQLRDDPRGRALYDKYERYRDVFAGTVSNEYFRDLLDEMRRYGAEGPRDTKGGGESFEDLVSRILNK